MKSLCWAAATEFSCVCWAPAPGDEHRWGLVAVAGFESATFTALHRDIVLDRPSFCRATAGVETFSVPF